MATKKRTDVAEQLEDVISSEGYAAKKIDIEDVTTGQVQIDDSAIVNVRSNVFGVLNYVDKRTGEEVVWPKCNSVQQMTFGMLRSMKANAIAFYKNQWVVITGFADENGDKYTAADIYKALYITQYYKNLVEPSDYQTICSWSDREIEERVAMMSADAKSNLVVALNTYIEKGILDSLKRIRAFKAALGCELKMPE